MRDPHKGTYEVEVSEEPSVLIQFLHFGHYLPSHSLHLKQSLGYLNPIHLGPSDRAIPYI
jgi:hypothetical protein